MTTMIDRAAETLEQFVPAKAHPDDVAAILCIREAISAVRQGNFGAGCIIVDARGNVAAHGHNQVFAPRFRSDAHAEMVALNSFEEAHPRGLSMRGYTLYTSLECCPMCATRIITAGCEHVRYVAADPHGGIVRFIDRLPGVWPELAARQSWHQASCSPELQALALEIFEASLPLNEKLRAR